MRTIKTLDAISDGKLYDKEDYAAIDAQGCQGCSACCYEVSDLVSLSPFDVDAMKQFLGCSFEQLLDDKKLHVLLEKGVSIPYLNEQPATKACAFLSASGRCMIHASRPDICRMFPLGRVYQMQTYKYFVQRDNCTKKDLKAVQISDWLQINDYEAHQQFILAWHGFVKAVAFKLKFVSLDDKQRYNDYLLDTFFVQTRPASVTFYAWFQETLQVAKQHIGVL